MIQKTWLHTSKIRSWKLREEREGLTNGRDGTFHDGASWYSQNSTLTNRTECPALWYYRVNHFNHSTLVKARVNPRYLHNTTLQWTLQSPDTAATSKPIIAHWTKSKLQCQPPILFYSAPIDQALCLLRQKLQSLCLTKRAFQCRQDLHLQMNCFKPDCLLSLIKHDMIQTYSFPWESMFVSCAVYV